MHWLQYRRVCAADYRVCADGGANRVFDELPAMLPSLSVEAVHQRYLPHDICGDLDSLRSPVAEFYTSHGVQCHNMSADQDSTDFEKCLRFVRRHRAETSDVDAEHIGSKEPLQKAFPAMQDDKLVVVLGMLTPVPISKFNVHSWVPDGSQHQCCYSSDCHRSPGKLFIFTIKKIVYRIKVCK